MKRPSELLDKLKMHKKLGVHMLSDTQELINYISHLESKGNYALNSIVRNHPVINIEIEKSQDQHYIKVGRLSNFKYAVHEDQGNGTYNRVGEEYDKLEKALAYSETLA